jgi:hypothetical protein
MLSEINYKKGRAVVNNPNPKGKEKKEIVEENKMGVQKG